MTWFLVILFFSLAQYTDFSKIMPTSFFEALWMTTIYFFPYIPLSFILAITFKRLPAHYLNAKHLSLLYVLVLVLFLPVIVSYQIAAEYYFVLKKTPPSLGILLTGMSAMGWWVLGFQTSIAYFMEVAATLWKRNHAQAKLTQALQKKNLLLRLSLMQCQLEPYFLLSSLDGIGNLIRVADRSLATTALARLSDLLRYVLRSTGNEKPTMADEIGFAKAYLSLQELRYGEQLQVQWILSDNDWSALTCPALLLHAFLEQALQWSLILKQEKHLLQVSLVLSNDILRFCVLLKVENASIETEMIKIVAVKERLDILYAGVASLELTQDYQQISIAMCIPSGELQDG
ncbi:histidine kinase [Undibacterium sp. Di27W]